MTHTTNSSPLTPHPPVYRELAESQGVLRPFRILVRMPEESRRLMARSLGCRLPPTADPEEEAWAIINRDLRGLQARTHRLTEKLVPFSRNASWWDIVTRMARRCGVKFYNGLKDEEVERLLFERLSELFVANLVRDDLDAVEQLAQTNPEFRQALESLQLSPNGTRAVLWAVALATGRADGNIQDAARRASDWIREKIHWSWTVPVTAGLRLLRQKLTGVNEAWASRGFAKPAVGNTAKVCSALAAIYFYDLVERTLEQVETLGT
ncbi:MAG: hypothetical protein AB1486_06535 [Planctomycetota bacterium]